MSVGVSSSGRVWTEKSLWACASSFSAGEVSLMEWIGVAEYRVDTVVGGWSFGMSGRGLV